ncbi:PREDICTED: kinesin-like protein KIF17, partial [Ficedula albicollis]|uniref:kinesin-like protein KIF17 n=1 Tax=Ficedula albicollis TaxID=59894 RepID=UPI0007AD8D95
MVGVESAGGRCLLPNPAEPPRQFSFHGPFGGEHSTEHVCSEIACLGRLSWKAAVAYGQTGSGRSLTMRAVADPSSQEGINPRHLNIFERMQLRAAETEIKDLQLGVWAGEDGLPEHHRRQERDLMLCQQPLGQVQPLIRRDCSYINLEGIRRESVRDEEKRLLENSRACHSKSPAARSWLVVRIPREPLSRVGISLGAVIVAHTTTLTAAPHSGSSPAAAPAPARLDKRPERERGASARGRHRCRLALDGSDSETIARKYCRSRRAGQILPRTKLPQAPRGPRAVPAPSPSPGPSACSPWPRLPAPTPSAGRTTAAAAPA